MTGAAARPPYLRLHIERGDSHRPVRAADIVATVERDRTSGLLPAGARLPPVRVLQHQLRIAKNSVQGAYEELVARGIVESRAREGYFVRSEPARPRVKMGVPALPVLFRARSAPGRTTPGGSKPDGAARGRGRRAVGDTAGGRAPRDLIDLGSVFIDEELLPRERLALCLRAVMRDPGLPFQYDLQGYAPLRALIAQRLSKRGIPAQADDVIITTGSQQALDLVARALEQRSIATENPTYGIGKRLFEIQGLAVTHLPLDPFNGIDLAEWHERLAAARPAALYLTTNFQNPTGYSYSTAELLQLLQWSQELRFGLVEDDWGSDMLSFSDYRPPLRALGGEHILYLNSFTKKLLPALRLGYLLANGPTRAALLEIKHVSTLGSSAITEAALYEFLSRGYYDTHLRRLQVELDARYHACLEALGALMPPEVRWTTPGGGPTLWLELPRRVDLATLSARLAERRVQLAPTPLSGFFGAPHLHGTRLGYAHLPVVQMQRGLALLAAEIRRQL